ncbi:hypothetical protein DVH24_021279 [Malus domestica]|uniref:Uncharacterized protein n=1 Tax=Malus domestica TaxID=3750 RepID=A0A498HTJ3_MALDO|nr:hypothetical protein DVH24_021279 [Malus domestica]
MMNSSNGHYAVQAPRLESVSDDGAIHDCIGFYRRRESMRWGRMEQVVAKENKVKMPACRRGEWWLTSRSVDVAGGCES